jgi:hypothetical protein
VQGRELQDHVSRPRFAKRTAPLGNILVAAFGSQSDSEIYHRKVAYTCFGCPHFSTSARLAANVLTELYFLMVIDLRVDLVDFRDYVCQRIDQHIRESHPKLGMIHFGFTFDQDGWVNAYFDLRPNACRDGEWTARIEPKTLLSRPHWYRASELTNLRDLVLIGTNGNELPEWAANPSLQNLASILGEFLRSSISALEREGLFQPLTGSQKINYCIEEFTGLYGWPTDAKVAKFVESLKLSGRDPSSHSI